MIEVAIITSVAYQKAYRVIPDHNKLEYGGQLRKM
jgi:hypothetical protein